MQNKDEKLLTAVAHWSYRFVSNGVPLSDFNDVCNSTKKWDDWCVEWEKKGHIHAALGDSAIKNGFNLSAADHYNTQLFVAILVNFYLFRIQIKW